MEESYPWLPDTSWRELAPFWEGLRRGQLMLPRCPRCGRFQWYPQAMCPGCRHIGLEWVPVAPYGRVYTYTILRRSFVPGFEGRLPLIIAFVEMEEAPGPRLITNLIDADEDEVAVGAPVEIVFREVSPGVTLPFVRLRRERVSP